MERHTVSRLIGAPPGYVGYDQGGLLTEAVTKHPHAVLLLDEIEKAHPDIYNLLLQVMDHGTLTDNNGRKADFRNVILVMSTNAGAEQISRSSIGFAPGSFQRHGNHQADVLARVPQPLVNHQFGSSPEIVGQVVDKFLGELEAARGARSRWGGRCGAALAGRRGFDAKMGARPMTHHSDHIKKPLAEELLFGRLAKGGHVRISLHGDSLNFDIEGVEETVES